MFQKQTRPWNHPFHLSTGEATEALHRPCYASDEAFAGSEPEIPTRETGSEADQSGLISLLGLHRREEVGRTVVFLVDVCDGRRSESQSRPGRSSQVNNWSRSPAVLPR